MAIESFGECPRRWMRQRGYTNAHLAQPTRQKSGTTISRLLNDQCAAQRCAAFLTELLADMDISPEEAAQLLEAVEVSRFGKSQYRANQVFLELMKDQQGLAPASGTAPWDALTALLTPWLEEGPCELMCFGCFNAQVLGTLGCLFREARTPMTITRYFDEELRVDLIFLLEHTLLTLGHPRCQLISIHGSAGLRTSGVAAQDALVIRNAAGATRLILPVSGGEPLAQDFSPENDLFGFYRRAMAADEALQHRYSSDFCRGSTLSTPA